MEPVRSLVKKPRLRRWRCSKSRAADVGHHAVAEVHVEVPAPVDDDACSTAVSAASSV